MPLTPLELSCAALAVFCAALAVCLWFLPDLMIRLFLIFGRLMYAAITLVLVFSIVEYFTGFFAWAFGSWGFAPVFSCCPSCAGSAFLRPLRRRCFWG